MSGQSLNARIGQQSSAGTYPPVLFVTNATMPTAPWDGMLVYNTDVSEFQIYSTDEDGWLDPFVGATGNQTYVGDEEPVGATIGDLWIKTPENILYRYDPDGGAHWEPYSDPRINTRIKSYWLPDATPPSDFDLNIGDLWFVTDMGNLVRRYVGLNDEDPDFTGWEQLPIGYDGIYGLGSDIYIEPPGGTIDALTGGLIVTDPNDPGGEPLVRLHPLGCTFKGRVVTDILTVMQDLIINGTAKLSSGASLHLENGVGDPDTAPTLSSIARMDAPWVATPTGYSVKGITWDYDNNRWIRLLWKTANDRVYLQMISEAGVVSPVVLLGSVLDPGDTLVDVNGLVYSDELDYSSAGSFPAYKVGVWHRIKTASGNTLWTLGSFNPANGSLFNFSVADLIADEPPISIRPVIGQEDQTGSHHVYFSGITSTRINLKRTGISGTSYGYILRAEAPGIEMARSMWIGTTDVGDRRLYIHTSTGLTYAFDYSTEIYGSSGAPSKLNRRQTWDFQTTSWLAWKGTGSGDHAFYGHATGILGKHSDYLAYPDGTPDAERTYVRYVDTFGTLHTALSPTSSYVALSRGWTVVQLPPAPPGVTSSTLYVGYLPTSDVGVVEPVYWQRFEEPVGSSRTVTLFEGRVDPGVTQLTTEHVSVKQLTSNIAYIGTDPNHHFQIGDEILVDIGDALFDGLHIITVSPAANLVGWPLTHADISTTVADGTATNIPVNTMGGAPSSVYDDFGNHWDADGDILLPGLIQAGRVTLPHPAVANGAMPPVHVDFPRPWPPGTVISLAFAVQTAVPDERHAGYQSLNNAGFDITYVTASTASDMIVSWIATRIS